MWDDFLSASISRCPFLSAVASSQGETYAASIAVNPTMPAKACVRRPILEEGNDFERTFSLFHGQSGLVPLSPQKFDEVKSTFKENVIKQSEFAVSCEKSLKSNVLATAPLASMSLGFFGNPDFGNLSRFLKQHLEGKKNKQPASSNNKPNQKFKASAAPNGHITKDVLSSGPVCPMRKILGPLGGVIFSSSGKIQCPAPIIQARAALAKTKPIRDLRPQATGVKLLAVGAISATVNVPCGAWRAHFEKFSPGWFIAVHASIPFIAMLRKAVILPPYAIIFTLATAIAGQAMGAKLERHRLETLKVSPPAPVPVAKVLDKKQAMTTCSFSEQYEQDAFGIPSVTDPREENFPSRCSMASTFYQDTTLLANRLITST